ELAFFALFIVASAVAGQAGWNVSNQDSRLSRDQISSLLLCLPSRCSFTSEVTVGRSRTSNILADDERIRRRTYSMLSPLNQLAAGAETPCLSRRETSAGTYRSISRRSSSLPSLVRARYLAVFGPGSFSSCRTTSASLPSLSRTGRRDAKSTRSLSRKGTRVSSP